MVARLSADGVLRTPAVRQALEAVPRHRFVEHVTIDEAYADDAVVAKVGEDGVAISAASQPTIVAAMLELAAPAPGSRVLEIGTGTGYNAALLATITGPAGVVVGVELDADLAAGARTRLDHLGLDRVEVVTGDGWDGHEPSAPYDLVVVTTGARAIAPAWVDQLGDGGRLVVPVVGDDGRGTLHQYTLEAGRLLEQATMPCGFLPMRAP